MRAWPPERLPLFVGTAIMALAVASAPRASLRSVPVVTLLGDSITAGYGLPAVDALPAQLQATLTRMGVQALVRGAGVSGDTSAAGLARADFSVQGDTKLCVVELGANDYFQSVPPAVIKANLVALIRRLRARHIGVLLLGGTVPTRTAGGYGTAFNATFPAVARAEHVPLDPDVLAGVEANPNLKQPDGIHPNAAGVRIIAAGLAKAITKALRLPSS